MIHLLQRAAKSIEAEGVLTTSLPRDEEEDQLRTNIVALLEREKCHARCDYLNYVNERGSGASKGAAGAIDGACRDRACRWMFRAARGVGLRRETAAAAIGYMDGFLCSNSPRARSARLLRRDFMLVAMTCLRTSIGAHEPARRDIDAASVAELSKGLLSARDIDECERDVLAHIIHEAQAPTTHQFLRCIIKLLSASLKNGAAQRVLNDSYRQLEASTADYACFVLRRSTVAVASVLNSLEGMPEDAFAPYERVAFVERMSEAFGVDVGSPLVKAVRRRLIARCPSAAKAGSALAILGTPPQTTCRAAEKRASVEDSPVCAIRFQEILCSPGRDG